VPSWKRERVHRRNGFLIDSLHLLVLCCFAIAQPLFDLLSRHAEFFIARHSEPTDILLLVLFLCLCPPLFLILVEGVSGLFGWQVRRMVHGLLVASLVACILLPALKQVGGVPGTLLIMGATLLGAIAALSYLRFPPVQLFVTVLAPAVVIFPGLLLFYSPVSRVVFVQTTATDGADIAAETTTPVVMVVFDEFPVYALMDEHRQIDAIRYPNFAALAREATWFRNATTVSDFTIVAVPALLTGNYPDGFRFPTAVDHPHSLFTLLGKRYAVQGFESRTQLCPHRLCGNQRAQEHLTSRLGSLLSDLFVVYLHILLPIDMSASLPPVTQDWLHFTANTAHVTDDQKEGNWLGEWLKGTVRDLPLLHPQDRYQHFQQFLETIPAAQEPTFYFLHTLLPHVPFIYLPSGKIYNTDTHLEGLRLEQGEHWGVDEGAVIQAYQRYLLQVGFVDTLLGQLIARLKTVGLYDRSLLVITADHGVSFRPNDARRAITESNYCDIMPVPLFIKAPYQREGVMSDRNVEAIDVLPTIADILGIRLPWPTDGRSVLIPALSERPEKVMFSGQGAQKRRLAFGPTIEAECDTLEQQLAVFGSGTTHDGLFQIGPYPALVGKRPAEIGVTGEGGVEVEIEQAHIYERVDLQSPFVPAYVRGRVVRNDRTTNPLDLAIAVNGTVQAVTQAVRRKGGELRFSTVVPESAFQTGENTVEVFVVTQKGQSSHLQFTRRTRGVAYTFVAADGEEMLVAPDRTAIHLVPHALRGHVDAVIVAGDFVEFRGWGADVTNAALPEAIVIFANGEFRYAGRPNLARPDVADFFDNAALQESGFSYTLPRQLLGDGDTVEVRVFAVSEHGVASELIYPPEYQWGKKPHNVFSPQVSAKR
jgi:hypothetical protein